MTKHSKLAEEIAVMFMDYLEATDEPKWSGAELASQIDQKLSGVREGHETLRLTIESLKKTCVHKECDDSWYSCPKSEEGCANDALPKDYCNCGVDFRLEYIEILEIRLNQLYDSLKVEGDTGKE